MYQPAFPGMPEPEPDESPTRGSVNVRIECSLATSGAGMIVWEVHTPGVHQRGGRDFLEAGTSPLIWSERCRAIIEGAAWEWVEPF